jgi:hypothetical protein
LLTATPHIETAIPTATDTPTAMPTATYTQTATPTSTPTQTSTPIPTQIPKMPTLEVSGAKFVAGGKGMVLRGADIVYFVQQSATDTPTNNLAVFKKDLLTLKQMGGNFISVLWNSGFLNNPAYVENLVEALEYAKSQLLWGELTLHSRGRKPDSTWQELQIRIADDQIIADWENLLNDPITVKRIADNVDIFSPLSEPDCAWSTDRKTMNWNEWKPIAEKTATAIRRKIKGNLIVAISGVACAGDARDALSNPPNLDNMAIEVHPYQWTYQRVDFNAFALATRAKGVLVFVGEMSHSDPLDFVEGQYKFLTANGISFAVFTIDSLAGCRSPDKIINCSGITPRGKLAEKYFNAGK